MLQPLLRVLVAAAEWGLAALKRAAGAAAEWGQLAEVPRCLPITCLLLVIEAPQAQLAVRVALVHFSTRLRAGKAVLVFTAFVVAAGAAEVIAGSVLLAVEMAQPQLLQLPQLPQLQIPGVEAAVGQGAALQLTTPPALAALASSVSGGLNKGLSWNLH